MKKFNSIHLSLSSIRQSTELLYAIDWQQRPLSLMWGCTPVELELLNQFLPVPQRARHFAPEYTSPCLLSINRAGSVNTTVRNFSSVTRSHILELVGVKRAMLVRRKICSLLTWCYQATVSILLIIPYAVKTIYILLIFLKKILIHTFFFL